MRSPLFIVLLQLRNTEYLEAEGELDLIDEHSRVLFEFPRGALVRQKLSYRLAQESTDEVGTAIAGGSESRDVDVCTEWTVAPSPAFGTVDNQGSVSTMLECSTFRVAPKTPLGMLLFSAARRDISRTNVASQEFTGSDSGDVLVANCPEWQRSSARAVAVRQALSVVLGVALPAPQLFKRNLVLDAVSVEGGAAAPSLPAEATRIRRGLPTQDTGMAFDATIDPFAPLLLAAEPGLLLNPSRLHALTRSVDLTSSGAQHDSPLLSSPTVPAPPPNPQLVDVSAPLLAIPLHIAATPIQEELSRQYLAVLSEVVAGLHGAVAQTQAVQKLHQPPAGVAATPSTVSPDVASAAAAVDAARVAFIASAKSARAARAALAAAFDPPVAPPIAQVSESPVASTSVPKRVISKVRAPYGAFSKASPQASGLRSVVASASQYPRFRSTAVGVKRARPLPLAHGSMHALQAGAPRPLLAQRVLPPNPPRPKVCPPPFPASSQSSAVPSIGSAGTGDMIQSMVLLSDA